MDIYTLSSIILSSALLIGYLSHRFIRLQTTIAIMTSAILISMILMVLKHFEITSIPQETINLLNRTDFSGLLLNGMLSFLLFAGALSMDITTLKNNRWEIFTLSSISTVISTFMIGYISYYMLGWLNVHLTFIECLLFGALISPTDPIAILATFKKTKAPKQLQVCVAGESLFNDGVGIVLFVTCSSLAFNNDHPTFSQISTLFLQQAVGGIGFGILLGIVARWLIKYSDERRLAIFATLACVSGGYSLATYLNISGPLAMVVAGLMVSHYIHTPEIAPRIREALELIWEVVDELMNAILFLLLGLELLIIDTTVVFVSAIAATIVLVLVIRWVSVAAPLYFFKRKKKEYSPYLISTLVWGGIRGGVAVALALSLPMGNARTIILGLTYGVVAFGIIVQGISITPLVKMANKQLKNAEG